jgi:hypothetical protein
MKTPIGYPKSAVEPGLTAGLSSKLLSDYSREVLVLYRKRSGEEMLGSAECQSAGAFSIQRLEGSRYESFELWILNSDSRGEG